MKSYIEINILVALAFLIFGGLKYFLDILKVRLLSGFWLRFTQILLVAAVGLPVLSTLLPKQDLLRPIGHVWSQSQSFINGLQVTDSYRAPNRTANDQDTLRPSLNFSFFLLTSLFIGLTLFGLLFIRNLLLLHNSLKDLPAIRRIGNIKIVVSEKINIPFSAWLGSSYVVLPLESLSKPVEMKLSIQHEIQHLRQRDVLWVYFIELLKIFLFFNPFIYFWSRTTNQLQEFACDEFLIRNRKVSLKAYGSCLIEAAQTALESRDHLVGTTSMAAGFSGKNLKRRIDMIFEYKNVPSRRWLSCLVLVGTLGLLTTVAYAEHSLVQGRKLTYAEAEALAKKANVNPKFPVEMNDMVFSTLNEWLSDDNTRERLKEGLQRMPTYEAMIHKKLEAFELADELLAIPLIESHYQNYNNPKVSGAGLWGFIVPTALHFGLHITKPNDPAGDERLVEHRETLAAMRYFTFLRHDFYRDYRLALRAYNEGESHVHALIQRYNTRDPWALERLEPSAENYLPKVNAALIVMRNPSILN